MHCDEEYEGIKDTNTSKVCPDCSIYVFLLAMSETQHWNSSVLQVLSPFMLICDCLYCFTYLSTGFCHKKWGKWKILLFQISNEPLCLWDVLSLNRDGDGAITSEDSVSSEVQENSFTKV